MYAYINNISKPTIRETTNVIKGMHEPLNLKFSFMNVLQISNSLFKISLAHVRKSIFTNKSFFF